MKMHSKNVIIKEIHQPDMQLQRAQQQQML
jgi:hypothetical protein